MATLTSFGDQVAKHLDQAQLDQLSQIRDREEYLENDDPLFDTLLDILMTEVSPEDWNQNTVGVKDDPSEYIDYVMDNMFKGDEPKWWEGGESTQLSHLINIIDEDNLGNVAKKQRAEKLDVAKIRQDLQTTKTIVTKKSEDPTEVDTTTVTISDPETDTKAVERISADPRIATTTTITTKEVGGDFDEELGHVLADVDTGSVVPESKVNEADQGELHPADKAGRAEFGGSAGSLNGKQVWMWTKPPPHDPENIGMQGFGVWATVGEWLPPVPASGGYYTIASFADGTQATEDDFIELKDIAGWFPVDEMPDGRIKPGTGEWSYTGGGANADFVTVLESKNINEDLQPMDLANLINATISVDKHKSKLGEDKDVIVLAMEVKNNDAAKDLMTFIERGYTDVIDADNISSENIDGDYVVFVEFERKDTFKNVLSEMLQGVEKLTGIDNWMFKHHKSSRTLTMEELHEKLPITPEEYDSFLIKEQNIKDQLQQLKISARIPFNK